MGLEYTDAALEKLSRAGYDPVYGARPLKRIIQQMVENPLSIKLLDGEFKKGDTILIDVQDKKFVFLKK